jgi:L-asparaginase II
MKSGRRVLIVFDGERWHVRRVRTIIHDFYEDEMVYHCSDPISSDHATLDEAAESAREWMAQKDVP